MCSAPNIGPERETGKLGGITDQAVEFLTGLARGAGLSSISELPMFEEDFVDYDRRLIPTSYCAHVSTYVDLLIRRPVWAEAKMPLGSGWFTERKEKRAVKQAGRELAAEIEMDDFVNAVSYMAHAEAVSWIAFGEALAQRDLVIELCQGREEELLHTPLEESMRPYRPGDGNVLELFAQMKPLSSIAVEPLFEETATLFDLTWMSHADGLDAMKEYPTRLWQGVLGGNAATPYATRLQQPGLLGDHMSLKEQLEGHPALSLQPFNIQVVEHCYSILLGEEPSEGIITDGPIGRHGGLAGLGASQLSNRMELMTMKHMDVLSRAPQEPREA